jgi:hypothetical protein
MQPECLHCSKLLTCIENGNHCVHERSSRRGGFACGLAGAEQSRIVYHSHLPRMRTVAMRRADGHECVLANESREDMTLSTGCTCMAAVES